jgi:hypothetical protein
LPVRLNKIPVFSRTGILEKVSELTKENDQNLCRDATISGNLKKIHECAVAVTPRAFE